MSFFKSLHRNSSENDSKPSNTPFFGTRAKLRTGEPNEKRESYKGDIFGNTEPFFKPQAKLKIGESSDKFEQEADRVADQVVNNTKSDSVQKKSGEEEIQQKPIASQITPYYGQTSSKFGQKTGLIEDKAVQKAPEEEPIQKAEEEEPVQMMAQEEEAVQKKEALEEEPVQKKDDEESVQAKEQKEAVQKKSNTLSQTAKPSLESRLTSSRGRGQKLSGKAKNEMESGFGADFSSVNIHTDQNAVQLSEELGAKAFAHGNDVYFNKGQYSPESSEGKHLLAHELTHTIQQGGMVQKAVQMESQSLSQSASTVQSKFSQLMKDSINKEYSESTIDNISSQFNGYNGMKKTASSTFKLEAGWQMKLSNSPDYATMTLKNAKIIIKHKVDGKWISGSVDVIEVKFSKPFGFLQGNTFTGTILAHGYIYGNKFYIKNGDGTYSNPLNLSN